MNKIFILINLFGYKKGIAGKIDDILAQNYVSLVDLAFSRIKDLERSKTIVNEVFVTALKRQEIFHSSAAIVSFLIATINEACNEYLVEMHQAERIQKLILGKETEHFQITQQVLIAVQEEIEALPRPSRQIFKLFFCGLKTRDIAEIVNLKPQTVRNKKKKAGNAILEALHKRNLLSI
jgi:RNA polymerase sigma factor (sigma-70 family)